MVTPGPRSGSSWNKSANTYGNRKKRMEPVDSFEPMAKACLAVTPCGASAWSFPSRL